MIRLALASQSALFPPSLRSSNCSCWMCSGVVGYLSEQLTSTCHMVHMLSLSPYNPTQPTRAQAASYPPTHLFAFTTTQEVVTLSVIVVWVDTYQANYLTGRRDWSHGLLADVDVRPGYMYTHTFIYACTCIHVRSCINEKRTETKKTLFHSLSLSLAVYCYGSILERRFGDSHKHTHTHLHT